MTNAGSPLVSRKEDSGTPGSESDTMTLFSAPGGVGRAVARRVKAQEWRMRAVTQVGGKGRSPVEGMCWQRLWRRR
jgi:hypothetical protein